MERGGRGGDSVLTLLLCGDVMTGRAIDQALPHPGDPRLHEDFAKSALVYLELAERAHGPIPRPVDFAYPWGEALGELARADARIVNLETSITRSDDYCRGKGINYRMHPDNARCLTAARIDCCALANNHVLDYGASGLLETLVTLERAGVRPAGAGRSLAEARMPAVVDVPDRGRVVVFAFGAESSGIPRSWAAGDDRPGIDLLEDLSDRTLARIGGMVRRAKRERDVVVASIHWGGNWGFEISPDRVRFARGLVRAGVDVVHGHSSHHVQPLEVFEDKLILYGCGDFLTDYEGIGGQEAYRSDLALMYFPRLDAEGRLVALRMVPMRMERFRLRRASGEDTAWLARALDGGGRSGVARADVRGDLHLDLERAAAAPAAGGGA